MFKMWFRQSIKKPVHTEEEGGRKSKHRQIQRTPPKAQWVIQKKHQMAGQIAGTKNGQLSDKLWNGAQKASIYTCIYIYI